MKFYIQVFFFCLVIGPLTAQQISLGAFRSVYSDTYNPGAIGWDDAIKSYAGIRTQWQGLQGAPQTEWLSVNMPIHIIKSAIGFDVGHRSSGLFNSYNVALSYNYKVINQRAFKLGIGLKGEYLSRQINKNKIISPEGEETISGYDFLDGRIDLLNDNINDVNMQLGLFMLYKNWHFGLTFVNLFAKPLNSESSIVLNRHYICNFGTEIELSNDFILKPSVLLYSDLVEWQGEALLDLEISGKYNVYIGARGIDSQHIDAAMFGGGITLKSNIHLGYIFEYGLSNLSKRTSGSHEIILRYSFGASRMQQKKPPIIYAPRYL